MHEVWKTIPRTTGKYEVSSMGRVRSTVARGTSRKPTPKILKGWILEGYPTVSIKFGTVFKHKHIHGLVLQAFSGPRPHRYQASHLNGIRTDNRRENLAWETVVKNCHRKRDHGTQPYGERCSNSKITEQQAREIYFIGSETRHQLAKRFGVSKALIDRIKSRRCWKHIHAD